MTMHNPPHPGEFIQEVLLTHLDMSRRRVALKLGVSPSTFLRLIKGSDRCQPRDGSTLSKGLGRSPESWHAIQDNYDLWKARRYVHIDDVEPTPISG
jgi:addiction module HigA family antidote